jgi:transcriptional regulator with XRE-family HTH domain|nr:MAG TPA: helix-turn-helix domain protein [Caudoviricetes sp.]
MSSKIQEARKAAGLTQEEMAEKLEIPKSTIEKWEMGIRIPPPWAEKLIVEKLRRMKKRT